MFTFLDVNSLYPSVQVKRKYPIGAYKKTDLRAGSLEEKTWITTLDGERKSKNKDLWNKTAAQVDITCPKNLNVPFLLERSEKGEVSQTLYDKVKVWYTGPELWEAKKLGYIVTRIHSLIVWEHSESIFDEFVQGAYDAKSKAERDTPKYTSAKTKMNALTGMY